MTCEEYFGDWKEIIDMTLLNTALSGVLKCKNLCPKISDIFKAFELCSWRDTKVLMLGMDPYPQKGVATGILFGNKKDVPEDNISPSLRVIKEAAINYEIPHGPVVFDQTLESWAKQGILMLNSSLTCRVGSTGSHTMVWRPFISSLLRNLSINSTGIVYILFGRQAQTFRPYINKTFNNIIEVEHPAYFARTGKKMPYIVFTDINKLLKEKYGTTIEWYYEV